MSPKSREPILVVDDEDDTRELLRQVLEKLGYSVIEAKDGKAALEALVANPTSEPCLIVLDLNMREARTRALQLTSRWRRSLRKRRASSVAAGRESDAFSGP